jgi:hypothetical protein
MYEAATCNTLREYRPRQSPTPHPAGVFQYLFGSLSYDEGRLLRVALRSFDFYDSMIRSSEQTRPPVECGYFHLSENADPSKAALEIDLVHDSISQVQVIEPPEDKVTLMSIFRKDLFVSVTLPICFVVCGAYAFTWTSFTRVDDANNDILKLIQQQTTNLAVTTGQMSFLAKAQESSSGDLKAISLQLGQISTALEVMQALAQKNVKK